MEFLFAPVHGIGFLIVPLCMLSFYCLLAILIHEVRCGRTTTVKARMRQFALREQIRRSALSPVGEAEVGRPLHPYAERAPES